MTHTLQALLLPATSNLERLPAVAHPVRLNRDLLLVLVTDELFDLVAANHPLSSEFGDIFWKFHPALLDLGREVAGAKSFGYIETDYFGGAGTQAGGAWCGEECVIAPRKAAVGPINEVLRSLGVVARRELDEFDSVGLSRHRRMEDWLEEPRDEPDSPAGRDSQTRKADRLQFACPAEPMPELMVELLEQVVAQVNGIVEAFVPECSINEELPAKVLIVGIAENVAIPVVMDHLLPKIRLLLAPGEQLDVIPFRFSMLPEEARIPACLVFRQSHKITDRPWWKLW